MKFKSLIYLLTVLAATSCTLEHVQPTHTYSYFKDITYKTVDGISLTGDMYVPDRLANEKVTTRPAVLVVHGGSWARRFGDMRNICQALAENGYVAFNITYRLAPQYLYPRAVEDVTDALAWLRKNADRYNIDPNRISGWGYSAGSHLVLMAGLDPKHGMHSIVAGGTPANLAAWPKSPIVKRFIGTTYAEDKKTWEDASPVNHVETKSPPVFMYHGENDTLVEIDQMHMMEEALKKKGVKIETYTIGYWGHPGAYVFSQAAVSKGIRFLETN